MWNPYALRLTPLIFCYFNYAQKYGTSAKTQTLKEIDKSDQAQPWIRKKNKVKKHLIAVQVF